MLAKPKRITPYIRFVPRPRRPSSRSRARRSDRVGNRARGLRERAVRTRNVRRARVGRASARFHFRLLNRGAQADARSATQVFDRGGQAAACGSCL